VLAAVAPRYTEVGRKAQVEGTARIEVTVDSAGKVVDAVVAERVPMGLSDRARAAALLWRFAPCDSGADPRRVTLEFVFHLADADWPENLPAAEFVLPATVRVTAARPIVDNMVSSDAPGDTGWRPPSRSPDR
jgi:TonB family protein